MVKVRVYELAKEFGVESKAVMAKLQEMGEFVRSASSTIIRAPVVRRLRKGVRLGEAATARASADQASADSGRRAANGRAAAAAAPVAEPPAPGQPVAPGARAVPPGSGSAACRGVSPCTRATGSSVLDTQLPSDGRAATSGVPERRRSRSRSRVRRPASGPAGGGADGGQARPVPGPTRPAEATGGARAEAGCAPARAASATTRSARPVPGWDQHRDVVRDPGSRARPDRPG